MRPESFGQRFGIQLSTMGAPTTAQGPAAVRFAPYIEELQEFFASACLRYGSPEDIIALTDRLESSPTFADDLSSMIRSIVLREGGQMPHSQMLEILALAIGGQKMDTAPQQYAQPLRDLLSFMTSVLRKPWNEPPGEAAVRGEELPGAHANHPAAGDHFGAGTHPALGNHSAAGDHSASGDHRAAGAHPEIWQHRDVLRVERGEVVPFPSRPRQTGERTQAAISAATDRARHAVHGEKHELVRIDAEHGHRNAASGDPLDDPRRRRKVPDVVGDPTPADRSAFDPSFPADDALEDPDFPEDMSDADASTAVTLPAIGKSSTVAARQAGSPRSVPPRDAGVMARPAPTSGRAAHAEPTAPAPSWKIAADEVRATRQVELPPVPAAKPLSAQPTANTAAPPQQPDPPRAAGAPGRAGFQPSPKAPLAGSTAGSMRKLTEEPAMRMWYEPRVPRTPAGILVAGAAILVIAGIVAAEYHQSPTGLAGKQPVQAPAANAPSPAAQSAAAAAQAKPPAAVTPASATPAVATASTRRAPRAVSYDDAGERGVAPPYSTPIPGQPALPKPTPYVAAAPQQPASVAREVRPPSNEVASTTPAGGGAAAAHEYQPQPYTSGQPGFHPGVMSSYRGTDPGVNVDASHSSRGARGVTEHSAEQIDVSSGMMAGYLISAPKPDYPSLARIAHIGGPVVLQAVVAKNGTVLATHVLSGHRLLRGAAEDAVRQWRFRPYMMDGHPVEVSTIVTVRFNTKK